MSRRHEPFNAQTSAGRATAEQPGSDARRLKELAEFLRLRRARLDPVALGLPVRARRRTPGLRREDVAELAGVSVAWYTSLEQGRPVNPSRQVVAALADALRLAAADRSYLFTLTRHNLPTSGDASPDTVLLQQLVDSMAVPAYCTDASTNVLAWNVGAAAMFGDYGSWPAERRNLLRLLFEEPGFAARLVDRDEYAARVVHTFRGRSAAFLKDLVSIELIDSLSRTSPDFKALWEAHGVRRTDTDTLEVDYPDGRQRYTLVNLQGVATPGVRFNAYLPADGAPGQGRRETARTERSN